MAWCFPWCLVLSMVLENSRNLQAEGSEHRGFEPVGMTFVDSTEWQGNILAACR